MSSRSTVGNWLKVRGDYGWGIDSNGAPTIYTEATKEYWGVLQMWGELPKQKAVISEIVPTAMLETGDCEWSVNLDNDG